MRRPHREDCNRTSDTFNGLGSNCLRCEEVRQASARQQERIGIAVWMFFGYIVISIGMHFVGFCLC